MSFPARYPGTCTECGARFHTGDPIASAGITTEDGTWCHASCDPDPDDDREPCPTCWLIGPCDCDPTP